MDTRSTSRRRLHRAVIIEVWLGGAPAGDGRRRAAEGSEGHAVIEK